MRRRLLGGYLAVTAVTLLILVVPLGRMFATSERDRLMRDIEHDATVVAALSEDALEAGVVPPLGSTLADYAEDPGGRIVVVDSQGASVADSSPEDHVGTSFLNRPEIATALAGERVEGRRHSSTLKGDLLYVAVPVASGGRVHGAVRITYPSSTLDRRVRSAWLGLAVLSGVVVLAVAVIGTVFSRLVTAPVQRLESAARRIAAGDLGARAPAGARIPELRQLAEVFNEMADRQQALLDAQRAFIGDASHQLRTPLAALRLQLENVESAAPLDLQPAVATARAEAARLGRISEALLELTKAASVPKTPTPLDLGAALDGRAALWSPIAAEQGVTIRVEQRERCWVNALDGAVEQILDNLVDNALDVSPEGSTVTISTRRVGDGVEVHVCDEGPGLSDEQRDRAFDRFWRGPEAVAGGTGLGLAVVAQLASASGGEARLQRAAGGGLDAVITLRRTEPPSRLNGQST